MCHLQFRTWSFLFVCFNADIRLCVYGNAFFSMVLYTDPMKSGSQFYSGDCCDSDGSGCVGELPGSFRFFNYCIKGNSR